MRRVLILVEGQTEETFVRDVLSPHLMGVEIFLQPIILCTKRVKSGKKFKQGPVVFGGGAESLSFRLKFFSKTP